MPICPQCTCWLLENAQNTAWVKCDQGHHYKKGEIKNEKPNTESTVPDRKAIRDEAYEFDLRTNRWLPRRNWAL